MATKVVLAHSSSNLLKTAHLGFSWTTLLFGLFVPLVRGDIKWFVIMLCLGMLVGLFTFGIGAYVVWVIFAFTYNKLHVKSLLEQGYKAPDQSTLNLLRSNGISISG